MITLGNLRLDFATNSSSTHSIVFLEPSDDARNDDTSQFGWDFFTLTDRQSKMEYLNQLILSNSGLPEWANMAIASAITGKDPDPDGYIDHQSVLSLPGDWEGTGLDGDFLSDLRAFFARDDVAILGGHDNTGREHDLFRVQNEITLGGGNGLASYGGGWVSRRDGDYWTLFSRNTGNKVKFAFDRDVDPPGRSVAPELIDVKITDYCPYGCAFCYQGSTQSGEHADTDLLRGLAYACSENRVFEVAIGGGEPTLHPDFVHILSMFRRGGTVPNFTTKNLAWLRDGRLRSQILELSGSFAYSVTDPKEVKKLATLLDYHEVSKNKVTIHYVMGSTSEWGFRNTLKAVKEHGFGVTLLGFKTTGRGGDFSPKDYSNWLHVVQELASEHELPKFGIDTVLAKQSKEELRALEIPSWLYYLDEGKHSMYIDAVAHTFASSSFVEEDEYQDLSVSGSRQVPDLMEAWNRVEVQ